MKAPEKFVPEVTSSHAGPAGSKRKRAGEDIENDASDLDEDVDDSEEDEIESAGEEEPKTRKKTKAKSARKPAAKKPKTNGTATHNDASAPIKLAARPKKPRKVAVVDDDAEGLYGKRVCSRYSQLC